MIFYKGIPSMRGGALLSPLSVTSQNYYSHIDRSYRYRKGYF
jgi:hypothetical protein